MPESRKRKKKSQKKQRKVVGGHPARRQSRNAAPGPSPQFPPDLMARIAEERRLNDKRRRERAEALTDELVDELVAFQVGRDAASVEDELCRRLGEIGVAVDHSGVDDYLDITDLVAALPIAAERAVSAALHESGSDTVGPWRVLSAIANVSFGTALDDADRAIAEVGELADRFGPPRGPRLSGDPLWARDGYGSRFGVIAPFTASDGPQRWYLWDVDACDYEGATVFSGYFPSPEQAAQAWRDGVGPMADDSVFSTVDDHALLDQVLPREEGVSRTGGEDENQLAEYGRARRLADVIREHLRPGSHAPRPKADDIAKQFIRRLHELDVELEPPAPLKDVAWELADTWAFNSPAALFWTCSPHRVARVVAQVREYYIDEFAEQILAVLPHWVTWLAERSDTPSELVDRSLPYAHGEPHREVDAAEKLRLRTCITE